MLKRSNRVRACKKVGELVIRKFAKNAQNILPAQVADPESQIRLPLWFSSVIPFVPFCSPKHCEERTQSKKGESTRRASSMSACARQVAGGHARTRNHEARGDLHEKCGPEIHLNLFRRPAGTQPTLQE